MPRASTKAKTKTRSTTSAKAGTKKSAPRSAAGARRYGAAASDRVASAVRRAKKGTLKSGAGRHPKVTSRKQAIAIGLSEARKAGAKVPPRPR
jgi:Family of unknown function (DUF6496)